MNEEDKARLDALHQKLQDVEARRAQSVKPKKEVGTHYAYIGMAYRMVIEMAAGIGVGALIGYGLDYWLGTSPIFFAVMSFLGFIAGIKVMLDSAREFEAKRKKEEENGNRS